MAMITAEKCRIHATECRILAASIDIPTQRSLEQSIMALNWEALADQIDDDNSQATDARPGAPFAGLFPRPLAAWSRMTLLPALSFCLSMISGQTLRVCPEGKPVPPSDQVRGHAFPDHAPAPIAGGFRVPYSSELARCL